MNLQDKYEFIGNAWLIASWFQADSSRQLYMLFIGGVFYLFSLIGGLLSKPVCRSIK